VIDDGSTDETSGWIESEYPSVKLIRQSNSGVSSARNTGIKRANGEWIALLDSDDEWLPKKLEKQFQSLMENPDYLFCHTNEIWIRKGVRVNQGKKHQKYGGMIFEKCLDMCRISPSSSLFHKSILEEVGIFDESLKVCEDYDLWLRITAKYPVLFLDEPMIIKYGGHEDQLSKVKDGIEKYRIQSLEKLLLDDRLSKTQNHQVTHRLIKKYKIYANGLKKRGKIEEYESVMKKLHYLN
jgi:glycosyltransferase involved in cell wall biosynthesis